jgi:hypothetical protein
MERHSSILRKEFSMTWFFVNTFIAASLKISVYTRRDDWDNARRGKGKDDFVEVGGENKSCVYG